MGIPSSTYRLQLHRDFSVDAIIQRTSYFRDLGIGAIYLSPILKARPGSAHGYDVVDPDMLNPELGSADDFLRLGAALQRLGLGMVVDIVPNHMCIADPSNWRWMDVLENGPSSPYARFFDIDWRPPREDLRDKVLLPVLGEQYGRVLENGELRLEYSDGAFRLRYADKSFPIAPRTWIRILEPVAQSLRVTELESIVTALSYLPLRTETDEERIRERQREKEVIKTRLARLVAECDECRAALADRIQQMNGRRGYPSSFDELELLLSEQAYRLSYWRVAADEINYRRFFDIDELASIRVEESEVFEAVHARILDGIGRGWITGLRVDHPDGLYEPAAYFKELQRAVQRVLQVNRPQSGGAGVAGFYVIAEKIMAGDERPRRDWAVHGTTGYGFLNELNGLFIDPASRDSIEAAYGLFTRRVTSFSDVIYECKRVILRASLSSELNVLSRRLDRVCQQHRHTRDFTLESLRLALTEVIACFPVYRTYISEGQNTVDEEDRRHILRAIREASRRNPAVSKSIFDSIASILLLEDPPDLSADQRAERRLFVMRLQQLTGAVMAKGVEDTAFYRQFPLASINEVGGDPQAFGVTPNSFHGGILQRMAYWPHNLLATSTHDTKRSEDLRARLNVLSEIPDEWSAAIQRWSAMNEPFRKVVDARLSPDRNAEYLLYQTLVGAWPLNGVADPAQHREFVRRIQGYMEKALHEAKVQSSWVNPNTEYDSAVRDFIASVLRQAAENAFLSDIEQFSLEISRPGLWNSLSQTVLKLTCPGVPDIYQGCELWDFSLVDPDNRRPIDYALRERLLQGLPLEPASDREDWLRRAATTLTDGHLKMLVTAILARFRRDNPDFFAQANYVPLEVVGELRDHVVAFARFAENDALVVVVGRFFAKLGARSGIPRGHEVWRRAHLCLPRLPKGPYIDLISGRTIQGLKDTEDNTVMPVSQVFFSLPVAVLAHSGWRLRSVR